MKPNWHVRGCAPRPVARHGQCERLRGAGSGVRVPSNPHFATRQSAVLRGSPRWDHSARLRLQHFTLHSGFLYCRYRPYCMEPFFLICFDCHNAYVWHHRDGDWQCPQGCDPRFTTPWNFGFGPDKRPVPRHDSRLYGDGDGVAGIRDQPPPRQERGGDEGSAQMKCGCGEEVSGEVCMLCGSEVPQDAGPEQDAGRRALPNRRKPWHRGTPNAVPNPRKRILQKNRARRYAGTPCEAAVWATTCWT